MNSKKGISMMSLMVTIVIMVILLTTATVGGITTVNNSKKISFANEISTLENAIRNYTQVNEGDYPIKESVVLDLGTLKSEVDQFSGETISSTSKIVLNEIDYEKLNYTSLKYGNGNLGENDEYLVSILTGKVYYAKGLSVGNKTYFSYTDDLKGLLEFNIKKNFDEQKAVITFVPSTIDWTNKEIKVTVKVPISYIVLSVRVGDENISLSSQDELYYYYIVTKASNYTVEVKYKKDSTSSELTAKYSVNNYDNTPPTVIVDKENQVYLSDFTKNQIGYAKIISKSDDLSGIKYIKYEENSTYNKSNITSSIVNREDVKSHFESNGSNVINDTIPINKGVKEITVYIEDNTGNWSLDSFDVSVI